MKVTQHIKHDDDFNILEYSEISEEGDIIVYEQYDDKKRLRYRKNGDEWIKNDLDLDEPITHNGIKNKFTLTQLHITSGGFWLAELKELNVSNFLKWGCTSNNHVRYLDNNNNWAYATKDWYDANINQA